MFAAAMNDDDGERSDGKFPVRAGLIRKFRRYYFTGLLCTLCSPDLETKHCPASASLWPLSRLAQRLSSSLWLSAHFPGAVVVHPHSEAPKRN